MSDDKPVVTKGKFCLAKDPRVYADSLPARLPKTKRALGLDLGTNCGAAFSDFVPGSKIVQNPLVMGQLDLSIGPWDSGVLRHVRLKQYLSVLAPDLIFYEEVKYDAPVQPGMSAGAIVARIASAAEFIGGLKATLVVWAAERGIPVQGVPVAALKKFATGKGNAGKPDMIRAANEKFGIALDPEDYEKSGVDNIADAAWACFMAVTQYSEGL